MVANPLKEEQNCRLHINKIIEGSKGNPIDYLLLVKQCLLKYAVSRGMVETFIKDFYIETGEIEMDKGMMIKINKR